MKIWHHALGIVLLGPIWVLVAPIIYYVNKKKKESRFNKILNIPGYYYQYSNEDMGMAFNIDEGKILLCNAKQSVVYDRSSIRDASWEIPGWSYERMRTSSLLLAPFVILCNIIYKGLATGQSKRNSGIIFQVADINHPEWFVHCSDERQIKRLFEIINQFMEGTLQKPMQQPNK